MNIAEAKNEIKNTITAYLKKDENGQYRIPRDKQRPVLLMGGPGIGKTAIMRQIAEELGVGLVSYTITHHTRQSAIGLPTISHRTFGDREMAVTEYTMSEIVASVYDRIEQSGISEGILFLDEINCVSETLAPTMLQFLQYKTFGSHAVPDGYIIVTAGNPPEYNKSVRDFDVVTLDRVRRLDVREDYQAWKEYAMKAGVHGAILSYLEIRRENFYSVKADLRGKRFATPRGWEDMSEALKVYEECGLPVGEAFAASFIQDPEIAEDFAAYYGLFRKYKEIYRVDDILAGTYDADPAALKAAPFDEKLSLIGLLSAAVRQETRDWAEEKDAQREVFQVLRAMRDALKEGTVRDVPAYLADAITEKKRDLDRELAAQMLGHDGERRRRAAIRRLTELSATLEGSSDPAEAYSAVRTAFAESEAARASSADQAGLHLTNIFAFLHKTFGDGQEMVLFLTALTESYYSLLFVKEHGNEAYYKYNHLLLLGEERESLREEIMQLL